MKDDTISRQAAIDALEKVAELFPWRVPGNRDSYDRYNEAWNDAIGRAEIEIEKLPSAQPGWIPIGAPMNSGQHYLVTLRQKFEGEETYRVRIMRLHEGHWLYPHHFPEWINDEMEQEVVAWMPLPEPYKGHTDAD